MGVTCIVIKLINARRINRYLINIFHNIDEGFKKYSEMTVCRIILKHNTLMRCLFQICTFKKYRDKNHFFLSTGIKNYPYFLKDHGRAPPRGQARVRFVQAAR